MLTLVIPAWRTGYDHPPTSSTCVSITLLSLLGYHLHKSYEEWLLQSLAWLHLPMDNRRRKCYQSWQIKFGKSSMQNLPPHNVYFQREWASEYFRCHVIPKKLFGYPRNLSINWHGVAPRLDNGTIKKKTCHHIYRKHQYILQVIIITTGS